MSDCSACIPDMDLVIAIVGIVVIIAVWVLICWIAGLLAPDDRVSTFFWLTFFIGPLGILAAVVASPRDPRYFAEAQSIAEGRTRYRCARCGANSDLHDPKGFACWRCGEKKYVVGGA